MAKQRQVKKDNICVGGALAHAHMHIDDPLELELLLVISHSMWVVEIKLQSSARAARTLNH